MENFHLYIGFLFLLTFALTFIIKYLAKRHKVIDIPNERSSHTIPTPRGGGLAIVISWYIGISILFYFKIIEPSLYYALMSGSLLAVISLIDDIFDIRPIFRMLVQLITASLALYFLKDFGPIDILGYRMNISFFFYPLVIIGIIWFINLFNFLDGIDAYASLEAICMAFAFFLFTNHPISLVLIASIAGFLIWNWPKAKIFMGDVGSTQLGFILIVSGIYFHNQNQFTIVNWLMLAAPFWFDATFTLYRRWRNKEKLSQAHSKHAYQRIVQAGFSHLKTDIYLVIINLVIIAMIYISGLIPSLEIPFLISIILGLYFVTKQIDRKVAF